MVVLCVIASIYAFEVNRFEKDEMICFYQYDQSVFEKLGIYLHVYEDMSIIRQQRIVYTALPPSIILSVFIPGVFGKIAVFVFMSVGCFFLLNYSGDDSFYNMSKKYPSIVFYKLSEKLGDDRGSDLSKQEIETAYVICRVYERICGRMRLSVIISMVSSAVAAMSLFA